MFREILLGWRRRKEAARPSIPPIPSGRHRSALRLEALEPRALLSFLPAVDFPAGPAPLSAVAGDFNGDGLADLAVADEGLGSANSVTVLLGNGNGTFQPGGAFAAGVGSYWIAEGDFNGDGTPDLAVTNIRTDQVTVLLGNGDGTFLVGPSYPANRNPVWVAVADVNGDGAQDLLIASADTDTVSVLLGNGDGSFLPYASFPAGPQPFSVAVADLNGDGCADLAVANFTDLNSPVSVLLGNGDGSFQEPVSYHAAGRGARSVALADMNGDGLPDIVVANSNSGHVSVLLGNGGGSFQPAVNHPVGSFHLAVADFDGDGNPDVAVTNYAITGAVNVLLGNGDGTLRDDQGYPVGTAPFGAIAADFNGDGFPDVVALNSFANTASVLLNAADWSEAPRASRGPASYRPFGTLLIPPAASRPLLPPALPSMLRPEVPAVAPELPQSYPSPSAAHHPPGAPELVRQPHSGRPDRRHGPGALDDLADPPWTLW